MKNLILSLILLCCSTAYGTEMKCTEFFYGTISSWVENDLLTTVGRSPDALRYTAQTKNAMMLVMSVKLPIPRFNKNAVDIKPLGVCNTPKAGMYRVFILTRKKV